MESRRGRGPGGSVDAEKPFSFIAAAIKGDETQHFTVLHALIEGLAVPTSALTPTMNADIATNELFCRAEGFTLLLAR